MSLKAFSSILFAAGTLMFASSAFAAGPEVFTAAKCDKCHSVASAGILSGTKPLLRDLSTVGAAHDQAWLTKFVKKEVGLADPKEPGTEKMHKGNFKGTDADLGVLTAWMAGLKTAPPAPAP